jgi:hypothetical protein
MVLMATKTKKPWIERLEDLAYPNWHGEVNTETVNGIAERVRHMFLGRKFTTVTTVTGTRDREGNAYFEPGRPDVRASQTIANTRWTDGYKGGPVRVHDEEGHDPSVNFCTDSFSWGLHAGAKITFDHSRMIVEDYSISGNHLWWVFALEPEPTEFFLSDFEAARIKDGHTLTLMNLDGDEIKMKRMSVDDAMDLQSVMAHRVRSTRP